MRATAMTLGAAGTVIGVVLIGMGVLRGSVTMALVGCGVIAVTLAVAGVMKRPETWARSVFLVVIAFGVIAGIAWAFAQF